MARRQVMLWTAVMVVAFLVGMTGAPGQVAAAGTDWLVRLGHVKLVGPVGDAVREML